LIPLGVFSENIVLDSSLSGHLGTIQCIDNIRMNFKEIVVNTRNWIDWTQDRDYWRLLVNSVMNLIVQ
jgi:hypothetical protein